MCYNLLKICEKAITVTQYAEELLGAAATPRDEVTHIRTETIHL